MTPAGSSGRQGVSPLLDLLERVEDLTHVSLLVQLGVVRPTHRAGRVEHEDAPLREPGVLGEHAEQTGDRAVGPEVAQEGEVDSSALFGEGLVRVDRVTTHAQDLGVQLREPAGVRLQDGELARSDGRPVERVEEHHDILSLRAQQS